MLLLFVIPALLLAAGCLYQWAGSFMDAKRLPPPGRILDVNGTKLHIRTSGKGKPAVVFESGVAASCVNWRRVQDAISGIASTATYDRAGFAWSGRSPKALSPEEMVSSLRQLLAKAGLTPPYVLVGHSFGALLVRIYADQWPEEIAGLVLVDPALVLEWCNPTDERLKMLSRGVGLSRRGALLARIGFVRLSLSLLSGGARALPKLVSRLSSGKGHSVIERLVGEVRKMPPELWPAIQSHWCRPASFESMGRHLQAVPEAAARVAEAKPLGHIPVTVISGSNLTPEQFAEHSAIAESSERGRHLVATESGHWIQLDQPEIVINAIREMVSNDS
jgi:pimeloyl-ACP methyl ester carboxylesterase